MEKSTGTWQKIILFCRFFERYDADPMDLAFYLRDNSASVNEELAAP